MNLIKFVEFCRTIHFLRTWGVGRLNKSLKHGIYLPEEIMKQKKSTKKFLKNAAKPKHGKEQTPVKKSHGKPKKPKQREESMQATREEGAINLKAPKSSKDAVKR